jgi:hypothetical protein
MRMTLTKIDEEGNPVRDDFIPTEEELRRDIACDARVLDIDTTTGDWKSFFDKRDPSSRVIKWHALKKAVVKSAKRDIGVKLWLEDARMRDSSGTFTHVSDGHLYVKLPQKWQAIAVPENAYDDCIERHGRSFTLVPMEVPNLGTVMGGMSKDYDMGVLVLPEHLHSMQNWFIRFNEEDRDEHGNRRINFAMSDEPADGFEECVVGKNGYVIFFPPMSEKRIDELVEDRCRAMIRVVQGAHPGKTVELAPGAREDLRAAVLIEYANDPIAEAERCSKGEPEEVQKHFMDIAERMVSWRRDQSPQRCH